MHHAFCARIPLSSPTNIPSCCLRIPGQCLKIPSMTKRRRDGMPFRKRRRKIESAGPDQEKLAQASAGALGNDATATVARPTFDPLTDEGKSALARRLAAIDEEERTAALGELRDWFKSNAASMTRLQHLRLWRALWYCLWLADKRPYQRVVAETIASLTDGLDPNAREMDLAACFVYVDAGLETIQRDWGSLDRWRMDKFRMLLRLLLSQLLNIVANRCDFAAPACEAYLGIIMGRLLSRPPNDVRFFASTVLPPLIAGQCEGASTAQVRLLLMPVFATMHAPGSGGGALHAILRERVVWTLVDAISQQAAARREELERERQEDDKEEEEVAAAGARKKKKQGKKNSKGESKMTAGGVATAEAPGAPDMDGVALGRVNTAALAADVFEVAAHPGTDAEERSLLYALAKKCRLAAGRAGHAYSYTPPGAGAAVVVGRGSVVPGDDDCDAEVGGMQVGAAAVLGLLAGAVDEESDDSSSEEEEEEDDDEEEEEEEDEDEDEKDDHTLGPSSGAGSSSMLSGKKRRREQEHEEGEAAAGKRKGKGKGRKGAKGRKGR